MTADARELGRDRRILLADDAAMFRELGSLFLARSGRVFTAEDGNTGFEIASRESPDVVVADLDMPGMTGEELCRRLKADPELSRIPVILVTGTELGEDRARAVRAGADDVIAKPISRLLLIQAVNRFLRPSGPRPLARVPIETRVQMRHAGEEHWGRALNVSRGGMYVEASDPVPTKIEVELEFKLPDQATPLSPTAQVVWNRPPRKDGPAGLGLQFLAMDRAGVMRIDDFVYERASASDLEMGSGLG